jgi:hypothetical protein
MAIGSSIGRTARSFGGLRMTKKVGGLSSRGLPPVTVILRPPKDLAVFNFPKMIS